MLQADEIHKMQIGRDIYIFSEDLQNIIYKTWKTKPIVIKQKYRQTLVGLGLGHRTVVILLVYNKREKAHNSEVTLSQTSFSLYLHNQ